MGYGASKVIGDIYHAVLLRQMRVALCILIPFEVAAMVHKHGHLMEMSGTIYLGRSFPPYMSGIRRFGRLARYASRATRAEITLRAKRVNASAEATIVSAHIFKNLPRY